MQPRGQEEEVRARSDARAEQLAMDENERTQRKLILLMFSLSNTLTFAFGVSRVQSQKQCVERYHKSCYCALVWQQTAQ